MGRLTKAATELFLVRHGATAVNESGRMQGKSDPGLSSQGQAQAQAAAAFLQTRSISAVITSDMRRTRESALIIGQTVGREYQPTPVLRERDYGRFDDLTFSEVSQLRTDLGLASVDPTHDWYNVAGVESDANIWERVGPFLDDVLQRYAGHSIVLVTHSGVIQSILYHVFQIPPQRKLVFKITQGCIAHFVYQHAFMQMHAFYPDPRLLCPDTTREQSTEQSTID